MPSRSHRINRWMLPGIAVVVSTSMLFPHHEVGSLARGQDRGQVEPPIRPDHRTSTCSSTECHPGVVDHANLHAPVKLRQCVSCHAYDDPRQHTFRLVADATGDHCGTCHQLKTDRVVHQPVKDGNCMGCHDPHGSDHPSLLTADPAGGLCQTCHTEDYMARKHVHGPVVIGACVLCHDAHSAGYDHLLPKSPRELCLDCHRDVAPSGLAASRQHRPMQDGCSTCHDPHASDLPYQVRMQNPDLCYTCHDGMRQTLHNAAFTHEPALINDGCVTCHNPHTIATRLPQPDLCLSCHDRTIETADGRVLADMTLHLEDNPNHHGPIRQGECSACHNPHAASHINLLFMEYPEDFYAPFEVRRYQLCFGCHDPDLVHDRSGTGLTGFRDGDLNLHWLHVNREKGRTCRACHEVHASKVSFHIRESVPFGDTGWQLPIGFEQAADGGSCAPGCHKPKGYNRITALQPPPESINGEKR